MSQQQFKKFVNPKNNAAIKERFKQEKKAAKKERAAAINKRFEEKRALRNMGYSPNSQIPLQAPKANNRQKYARVPSTINSNNKGITPVTAQKNSISTTQMPLNKFMAHCGITSRRDAIPIIKEGKVTVNGHVIIEPGFKVRIKIR